MSIKCTKYKYFGYKYFGSLKKLRKVLVAGRLAHRHSDLCKYNYLCVRCKRMVYLTITTRTVCHLHNNPYFELKP